MLGRTVSRTAERQREGLLRIAAHPSMLALGVRLGKPLRAEDLYGSSAGAIGLLEHGGEELGLTPGHGKRVSLAYAFEYWSRSLFPRLRSLSHAINLRWMLGRKPWS